MSIIAESASGLVIAGVDIGFGTIKTDVNYSEPFFMQSTVSEGGERGLAKWSSQGKFDPNMTDLKNQLLNMDVIITNLSTDSQRHVFLGRLATQEGQNPHYCWEDDKSNDDDAMSLLVSQLAAAELNRSNGHNSSTVCYVGTGLPVKQFLKNKDSYERNIKGRYEVEMCSGPWEGSKCVVNIIKCRVFPQAWGIYYNETRDPSGTVIKPNLLNGHVLVIDPGFRTTDYAVFLNDNIVDDFSDSINFGVSWALRQISNHLANKENIQLDEKELDHHFLEKDGICRLPDGRVVDLKIFRDAAYRGLATKINNELSMKLEAILPKVTKILIGGGGGVALFDQLLNYEDKEKILVRNPRFGNASGFKSAVATSLRRGMDHNG